MLSAVVSLRVAGRGFPTRAVRTGAMWCSTEATEATDAADAPATEAVSEDELAVSYSYYESLVHSFRADDALNWERINALTNPHHLVLLARTFASTDTDAPELFTNLAERLDGKLGELEPPYLAAAATAFSGHTGTVDKSFFEQVQAAARGASLSDLDQGRIAASLETAGVVAE